MRLVLPNRDGKWRSNRSKTLLCPACKKKSVSFLYLSPDGDQWSIWADCVWCQHVTRCPVQDDQVMDLAEEFEGWTVLEDQDVAN